MTTALAMAAVLVGSGSAPAAVPAADAGAERVLQSVAVSMSPDGTTTTVGDSVVRTAGSVEDAETTDGSYAPQEVVGDLPVRVLTAYRTAEGAGTDLADLQGYTGRIAIDVTVQNLTVKPEVLTYDAAGVSRQQAALVGSPLTITASTALGDLAPAKVVTKDDGTVEQDSGVNVTNGVLGQNADGTTVQWAALLAPPILSSSAELSLVVDAKDFVVPTIDLSVQPGLVTDPSIGGLVDGAFNPANSTELELQQRTIGLIGDVNEVLSRASGTISDVRTNLTSSAETLGTQTVSDLQSSTESVTSNMRSLDGALQSLQGDLGSTLDATGSSALGELDQAVSAVDQMLGDTSAQPPTAQVRGNGCETTVADPQQSDNVYGSLLEVSSQLDGYSKATRECQAVLQKSIVDSIGPAPDDVEAECTPKATSVTCSLFGSQETFIAIADDLKAKTAAALDLLNPELYTTVLASLDTLDGTVVRIKDITDQIGDGRIGLVDPLSDAIYGEDDVPTDHPENRDFGDLEVAQTQIEDLQTNITAFDDGIEAAREEVESIGDEVDEIALKTQLAAEALCAAALSGRLTPAEQELARYLLLSTSCAPDPKDGETGETGVAEDLAAQAERLRQVAALDEMQTAADKAQDELDGLRDSVDDVYEYLQDALEEPGPDEEQLKVLVKRLNEEFTTLTDNQKTLRGAFEELEENAQSENLANIEGQINALVDDAKAQIQGDVADDTRSVYSAGAGANNELGTMLERSANGLNNASGAVVRNGRQSLSTQQREFAQAQAQSSNQISATIEKGLSQVNTGVSSSTRDMEAATTLLIGDLRKVLLDLGDRRVGGGGLLGAMATNAATARSADYQLALASDASTSYANVRGRDISGIMLRQAQTDAAMQMLVDQPAFQLDLPSGSVHRTVYSYTIGEN